jgi:DNA repair exonuclease SbcCD ATPase subunit
MTNINFKSVEFQNFFSVGKTPLKITFKKGINIITGENLDNIGSKNGIGKTTILNAIFWNIFGETINDLKKNKICNNITKEECSSCLTFDIKSDSYKIKRILDPAKIEIYKNNEDITLSTIEKNNDFIKNLLNINQEVFRNSVILTSENTIPFMAQKKIDKRKFIEGVMNLNIFGDMLLKIRKDYNEKKKECDTQVAIFTNNQKTLEDLKKQQIEQKSQNQIKINSLLERIEKNKEDIKKLKSKNSSVQDEIEILKKEISEKEEKIDKVENLDIPELNSKLKEIQFDNKTKKQKIEDYKNEYFEIKNKGFCPTCKRSYSENQNDTQLHLKEIDDNIEILKTEILNLSKKENEILEKINKVKAIISGYKQKNQNNRKKIEDLISLENKVKIIETRNSEIYQSIEDLKNQKDNFEDIIKNLQTNIDQNQNNIKELYKDLDVIENAKLIVSEEGVKTVIIKKILKFLNERLNYYLSFMEAPCVCYFDETFDTNIKNLNGKEIDYWNLSGGERKRVDSSIIFTFQDLLKVQTGTFFNISMYDEWADSALDEKGMSKFLELLRYKTDTYNECIYLISHNPNLFKNDVDDIISLEKKNGVTTLKIED